MNVCLCTCVRLTLLVSQLVCHGEGQREARVLADAATAMRLTHPRHVGQAQSLTGHVDGCTDILPLKRCEGQISVDTGQDNKLKIVEYEVMEDR